MKKKFKKSSVLKYRVLKVIKNNRIKGKKLIVEQRRLLKKFLFIPIKWERKIIILWKPSVNVINPEYNIGDWLIIKADFDSFALLNTKHSKVCRNKKLLNKIKNY